MMFDKISFRSIQHQEQFDALLEEMALSEQERAMPSKKLRRQLAFIYLIALYQEDYVRFEGEGFYIEGYLDEELTIDGPTYLFDEAIGQGNYPHEQILAFAKKILKGEELGEVEIKGQFAGLIHEAMKILYE